MIQLNNYKTGQFIAEIEILKNKIVAKLYNNGFRKCFKYIDFDFEVNKNIKPDEIQNINEIELNQVFNHILSLPEYSDFEISNDERCWIFEKGFDNLDMIYRVYIPIFLFTTHVYTNSPLGQIIAMVAPYEFYSRRSSDSVVQYLQFIDAEPMLVLKSYEKEGLIIYKKEVV